MREIKLTIVGIMTLVSLAAQTRNEPYRPFFHYSPEKNWMNDPNGLVFYNNKYHLFYQYNPSGIQPGNTSWGHAVSTDLVNWEEKPVAIPVQNGVMAYSGSVVVDWNNTSGFGTNGNPPLVAIYTGATSLQDQRIAYSNDEGLTWTNYSQNPVVTLNNNSFRDPKVFWHGPTSKWIMAVAHPDEKKIYLYSSPDLRNWTYESTFQYLQNISTLWECPDLFRLPVDNNPGNMKWVLVHTVNPSAQYFIGDFDGQRFNWQNTSPSGILIADFENSNYGSWAVIGSAFGTTPSGTTVAAGYLGEKFAYSFFGGNQSEGKIISPVFTIQKNNIGFLIGGGYHPDHAFIRLVVNGQAVRTSTGLNEDIMKWRNWDVSSFIGHTARIEIVDSATGAWGHINIDHIMQSDAPIDNANYGQVDYGRDFYALQSFSDIPDGRRIWMAWMNNWSYALKIPTSPWKGMMSIPREVKLETHNGQLKLVQKPVSELGILRKDTLSFRNTNLGVINTAINHSVYKQFELKAKIAVANKKGFRLTFKKNGAQYSQYTFDFSRQEIVFNRTSSGALTNDDNFNPLQVAPLVTENGFIDLHLFVDNSSAELFTANGQIVMSNQIFPDQGSNQLEIAPLDTDILIDEFDIWNFEKTIVLPDPPTPPASGPNTYLLFQAYPNPIVGDNELTVKINNDNVGKLTFKLFNASGMLIHEFQPNTTSTNIPVGQLTTSKGIYFLKATNGQTTQTRRILVLDK